MTTVGYVQSIFEFPFRAVNKNLYFSVVSTRKERVYLLL